MVKYLKECWFGILLFISVGIFLLFVMVVETAPHNDLKMRGFTPCTYEMAANFAEEKIKIADVFFIIGKGYVCYFEVMKKGAEDWWNGKQRTPWENYWFEEYNFEIDDELSEPFSDDLLKANRLD